MNNQRFEIGDEVKSFTQKTLNDTFSLSVIEVDDENDRVLCSWSEGQQWFSSNDLYLVKKVEGGFLQY